MSDESIERQEELPRSRAHRLELVEVIVVVDLVGRFGAGCARQEGADVETVDLAILRRLRGWGGPYRGAIVGYR